MTTPTEDNAIPASGSDMRVGDVAAYCVIGPTVNSDFGRTWKKSLADAVKHAKNLINRSVQANGQPKCRKLFVVQVVEVIEVPGPQLVSRKITEEDLEAGE